MPRVMVVGGRSDHKPGAVPAEHEGDRVGFATLLRAADPQGVVVWVDGPKLTPDQVVAWVKQRMADFQAIPGSRESPSAAIRRKVVAAQGQPVVQQAKAKLDAMLKMELAMMLSKDSHTQALPLEEGRGAPVVTVEADGAVNLNALPLYGSDGDAYEPAEGENDVAGHNVEGGHAGSA